MMNFDGSLSLGGRNPYSREEDESIIQDIIRYKAYDRIKGNQFWMECEERGEACKGLRTWQSMKERFRKKIAPNLILYTSREEMEQFENGNKDIHIQIEVEETVLDHDPVEPSTGADTDKKPYQCKACDASYDSIEEMKIHVKVHLK